MKSGNILTVTQRRVCEECDYDKSMTWACDTPVTIDQLNDAIEQSRFKPHGHKTLPIVVTLELSPDGVS